MLKWPSFLTRRATAQNHSTAESHKTHTHCIPWRAQGRMWSQVQDNNQPPKVLTWKLAGLSSTGGSQNDPMINSIFKLASSKTKISDCPINTHANVRLPQEHVHYSALPWTSVEIGSGPATDDSRAEKSSTVQYKCIKERKKPDGFLSWKQRPFGAVNVNQLTTGYLGTERDSCVLMWGQGT